MDNLATTGDEQHRSPPFSFSLDTLFGVITLLAVLLGVASVLPGLAVFLTLLVVPAYLRTAITLCHRRAGGEHIRSSEKFKTFCDSFWFLLINGAVLLVAVSMICMLFSCLTAAIGSLVADVTGREDAAVIVFGFGLLIGGCVSLWLAGIGMRTYFQDCTPRELTRREQAALRQYYASVHPSTMPEPYVVVRRES